ncbi:unnamed protein product [Spodoptera littoralis]|uniref:Kazal-like domain-containing protein n=1 Tax=Spodoptera littoralis TaxID=7109 RepID=A0A9P0HVN1_SPOLI|nr:unnamed protein product [Spodoptera littoralis]CAH1636218.1 unnamed protein product [Spodoptera littoralis]
MASACCQKVLSVLRKHVLKLKAFDIFMQGTYLLILFLETNAYLLLRRDARAGYHSTLTIDYVRMGTAGVEFLLGAIVAWWGKGKRNRALSGWLGLTAAAGLLVLAFPYAETNPVSMGLCRQEAEVNYTGDKNLAARTTFLIITIILCALTKLSIWTHGLTYLDDHNPTHGPEFYGGLITARITLGLDGDGILEKASQSDDWWQNQLILTMVTLFVCFIFSLFPKRMASKEMDVIENSNIDTGLFPTLKRLVTNKVLILQTIALSLWSTAVLVFAKYEIPYAQGRYNVEATRGSDVRSTGDPLNIFRTGLLVMFVMIVKINGTNRPEPLNTKSAAALAFKASIFVTVFLTLISFTGCNTGIMKGLEAGHYEQPSCSSACGCTSERYGFHPVCMLETRETYFSPCHAGCNRVGDLNGISMFYDCGCSAGAQNAVRGSCMLENCLAKYATFQMMFVLMLAIAGAGFIMQGMAILRSVRPVDKVTAMGASISVVSLLAFVIGHFVYMTISQMTCVYFSNGECLLHSNSIWFMSALSVGLAVLSGIISFIVSKLRPDTDDNEICEL